METTRPTLNEVSNLATLDVATTSRFIGIGLNQTYAAIRNGELPSVRIGRNIRVPVLPLLNVLGIESAHAPDPKTLRRAEGATDHLRDLDG